MKDTKPTWEELEKVFLECIGNLTLKGKPQIKYDINPLKQFIQELLQTQVTKVRKEGVESATCSNCKASDEAWNIEPGIET